MGRRFSECAGRGSELAAAEQRIANPEGSFGVDMVTLAYHDGLMMDWKTKYTRRGEALRELTAEHVEWGDKNDRLEARRKELQVANTELGAKLIEDAKAYDMLKEGFADKQLAYEKEVSKNDSLNAKNKHILKLLQTAEDTVAG